MPLGCGLPDSGFFCGISWEHPFGVEPGTGRDLFARLLYGLRISLLIALTATILTTIFGTVFGIISGYLGGLGHASSAGSWTSSSPSRSC